MEDFYPEKLFIRNIFAPRLLDYFLVSAVSALLIVRFYLDLTGYPEVSIGHLHFAHVLWGGLLMLVGQILLINFLSSNIRVIATVIAGAGFGVFIDEIGKFITADNNYFYQPTAAIIYLIFIVLFLSFRLLNRNQLFTKKEYLANALELMENVALEDLDKDERSQIKRFLNKSDSRNPLVVDLKKFIAEIDAKEPEKPSAARRFWNYLGTSYRLISTNKYFSNLLIIFFITNAAIALLNAVVLGRGFINENNSYSLEILQTLEIGFSLIAAVPILIGISRIRNRLFAYRMFRFSTLVSIFLVQSLSFYQDHFSASFTFFLNVLILIALDYMITQERTIRMQKNIDINGTED